MSRRGGRDVACVCISVCGGEGVALGFVCLVLRQLEAMTGNTITILHALSECISTHSSQNHSYTNTTVSNHLLLLSCTITQTSILCSMSYSTILNNFVFQVEKNIQNTKRNPDKTLIRLQNSLTSFSYFINVKF